MTSLSIAKILMHHNYTPQLIDPQTGASIDAAIEAQRKERIHALAQLRASFDDVQLRTCHPALRAGYLEMATTFYDAKLPGLSL